MAEETVIGIAGVVLRKTDGFTDCHVKMPNGKFVQIAIIDLDEKDQRVDISAQGINGIIRNGIQR